MILERTVLILGAGASAPFDYPVGAALTERVKKELRPDQPGRLHHELIKAGFRPKLLRDFRDHLRYSQRPSIDSFLEDWEKEFMKVGKAAIAASLIRHEDRERIVDEPNWYRRLFNEMTDGKDFSSNQLSIVTFNYDRSLEYFFLRALPSRYHVPETQAVKWLSQLPIIHLYGSLGALPELSRGGRPYGETEPEGIAEAIAAGAKGIQLARGGVAPETFARAREWMGKAQRIIVIGFGFEQINRERLGITDFVENAQIFATLFNVSPVDERRFKTVAKKSKKHAEYDYDLRVRDDEDIEWFKGDALKFMEKHGIADPEAELD